MSGISSSSQSLSRKNSSEEPQTDWVCTNCNNLNFSFRQKCNRCKVQSREDNDRILQGGYRYYEPYCLYSDQFAMLEMNAAIRSEQMCTPRKDKEKNYSTQKVLSAPQEELPSVSPLLKKYRAARQSKLYKQDLQNGAKSIFRYESWATFYSQEDADEKDDNETTDQEESSSGLLTILNLMIV